MPHPRTFVLTLGLLAAFATQAAAAGEFPDEWYIERIDDHKKFEGGQAPALTVGEWVGAPEGFSLEKTKGKILVLDFWATWCGPCIAAMPHNTKLAKKYAGEGVEVLGICISGAVDDMPGIVKANGADYPNAYMKGNQIEKDWPVQWFPTYAVVDREGVVRAMGLNPTNIEDVLEKLLEEEAEADGRVRVRATWLEGDSKKRERLAKLEDKAQDPPALVVENWLNAEAMTLKDLEGKVVVLDFWAPWSPNCIAAIQTHNALYEKHGKDGLVIIGVAATYGGNAVPDAVKEHGITYPVAIDVDNKTNTAYGPDGFPDYYVIDRAGKLRIADLRNDALEEVVAALLAEKPSAEEDDGAEDAGDAAAPEEPAKPEPVAVEAQ
ncbi:MAG: TlpA family protein disulfide reductase [Phycisphaeraceae bacterium]